MRFHCHGVDANGNWKVKWCGKCGDTLVPQFRLPCVCFFSRGNYPSRLDHICWIHAPHSAHVHLQGRPRFQEKAVRSRDLVVQEMAAQRADGSQGHLRAPVGVWLSVKTGAKPKQACGKGVTCCCKVISTKLAVTEQMSVKSTKQISPHLRFLSVSDSGGVFLEGDPRRMSVTAWLAWTP